MKRVNLPLLSLQGSEAIEAILILSSLRGNASALTKQSKEIDCHELQGNSRNDEWGIDSSLRTSEASEAIQKNNIDCHDFLQKSRNDNNNLYPRFAFAKSRNDEREINCHDLATAKSRNDGKN